MNRIRALPEKLASLPEYAMRCKLYGVPFTDENLADKAARKEFYWDVGMAQHLTCKLKTFDDSDKTFAVKFRLLQGPGAPRNFNYVTRKKYAIRDTVEQLLAEDRQIDPDEGAYLVRGAVKGSWVNSNSH